MNIDITEIILAFISIIIALISAFIIPWIRSKFSKEKIKLFEDFVSLAVRAAEQIFSSEECVEKFNWVKEKILERGFTYDDETILTTIEAKVLDLHNELYGTEKWVSEE